MSRLNLLVFAVLLLLVEGSAFADHRGNDGRVGVYFSFGPPAPVYVMPLPPPPPPRMYYSPRYAEEVPVYRPPAVFYRQAPVYVVPRYDHYRHNHGRDDNRYRYRDRDNHRYYGP